MKFLLILFGLSFFSFSANAFQVADGRILNSESGEGIPYVNIGIIKNRTGTVSDEEGNFSLRYENLSDKVSFSAIGFRSLEMSVSELKENHTAELIPVVYELEEVSVDTRGYEKPRDLGYNFRKRGQSIGFGSTMLGTEIGGLIEIDRETVVYSAHFTVNHTNREPLLLRVNLYEFKDGKPGRNLIPENVILKAPDEPGTVSVDLSDYKIKTDTDVLLSLEWIKGVQVESTQGITFRARNVRRDPNVYFRSTSLAAFTDFKGIVDMQIGFYLKVQQISK